MPRLLFSALWFALLLPLAACPSSTGGEDAAGTGDAVSPAVDASTPPDTAVPPDGTVSPDLAPPFFGPPGAEASDTLCSNGTDDDSNGFADCNDFWCRDSVGVTVCSALENTAAACRDGVDNPESPTGGTPRVDGLVDCADPDCAKNPALPAGICPPLRYEDRDALCGNGSDDDGDGLVDCADPDCLHAGVTVCPRGSVRRVLFDDAHRERAGSADWVVDVPGRHPWPSVPQQERDWAGALSSFGVALVQSGRYTVETLTALDRLSYGDATRPQDLANYDVLVLPETSAPLDEAEAAAVSAFVAGGGGLLLVIDHFQSDRDGNGWDSVQVTNDFFARSGAGNLEINPFGFAAALIDYNTSGTLENINRNVAQTIPAGAETHPVLAGPFGTVTRVGMFRGGLLRVLTQPTAQVTVLMHAVPLGTPGWEQGSPYVLVSQVGSGRVVAVGDSAILNDGTDSHGSQDSRFDAWHSTTEQNAALFLNAVEWLAQ
jgi:hypothetical protein